jgi:glyoxylase-like metal-dependent hydrolase (beta-lactamase superfamily II)
MFPSELYYPYPEDEVGRMSVEQVVPGVFQVSLGMVNVDFLVGEDVTVIDTGVPGSAPQIVAALREIGKEPRDVGRILLTHLHADHTGSAKALQDAVAADGGRAEMWMHAADAEVFQMGLTSRAVQPSPGLLSWLVFHLFIQRSSPMTVEPARVDRTLTDGETLPVAGGLEVIHVPGHTAGSVVLLWPQQGGVLFAGDSCGQMAGRLGYPPIFEDFEQGKAALRRLAGLRFENALFGHGKPIRGGASQVFRMKWG